MSLNPIIQSLIAGMMTFAITALGSSLVFLVKKINTDKMIILLSLSAGIMLSSSFFSLINPAIESANKLNIIPWMICSVGILLGCLFLYLFDKCTNSNSLLLSITLHNFPEGLHHFVHK